MGAMGEHDSGNSERRMSEKYTWVALALAAIAGGVDAIGYILLAQIFTSHMSGNTVALTIRVAMGSWLEAWRHFEPIVAFFFGVALGLALTDLLVRTRLRRTFGAMAGIEVVLLLAFFLLAHPPEQWMVVLPASAMGVQNAMLRRVGEHRVRTTYITGMLTNTAQGLVDSIVSVVSGDGKLSGKLRDFATYGGIWFCFAAGGVLCALLELHRGPAALLAPISALSALVCYDAIAPFTETG